MKFNTLASALVLGTCACLVQAGTAFVSQTGGPLTQSNNSGLIGAPYALGLLGAPFSSVFVTLSSPGSFNEFATLSIPAGFAGIEGASNTYSLAVELPSGPMLIGGIDNFSLKVFSGTPISPEKFEGSFAAGRTFSLPDRPDRPAGDYFLQFTGTVNGVGGQYSAAMHASPVPEPGIYLMTLLGLGVLAWRVRRTHV